MLACAAVLALVSAAQAVAASRTIRVVTHNIAGGYAFGGQFSALDAAVRQARTWEPDVILLQEVCEGQARAFRERLPGYHTVFTMMRPRNRDCVDQGPHFGQMIASRWPLSGLTRTALRGDDHRGPREAVRYFKLTCVLVAASEVPAGRLRACVTHLRAGHKKRRRRVLDAARTAQVHRIRKALHGDIARNVRVIVAGDFNARPQDPALDEMYRLERGGGNGGAGDFYEGDQTDHRHFLPGRCGPFACRSGQDTCCHNLNSPDLDRKYDYVFFSRHGVSELSGRPVELGGSDHMLYRASARFEF